MRTVRDVKDDRDALSPDTRPLRGRMLVLLSVAALGFSGLGLAACGAEESPGPLATPGPEEADGADVAAQRPPGDPAGDVRDVTLSELLANTALYVGQTVTVSGPVAESDVDRDAASPAAFTIGVDRDDDVLVLPTTEADVAGPDIRGGSPVRVQGMVREVDDALLGAYELVFEQDGEDAFIDDYLDDFAVVATTVDTSISATGEAGDGPME